MAANGYLNIDYVNLNVWEEFPRKLSQAKAYIRRRDGKTDTAAKRNQSTPINKATTTTAKKTAKSQGKKPPPPTKKAATKKNNQTTRKKAILTSNEKRSDRAFTKNEEEKRTLDFYEHLRQNGVSYKRRHNRG